MFEDIKIECTYIIGNEEKRLRISADGFNKDIAIYIEKNKEKDSQLFDLFIVPNSEVTLKKLVLQTDYFYQKDSRIFVNGYQSWTDSSEHTVNERFRKIPKITLPILYKYQTLKYGDYTFKKYSGERGCFHGYTYSYIRNQEMFDLIGSLTEQNGFTIIEHHAKTNQLMIEKDCSGLSINASYHAFQLIYIKGKEDEVFDAYFKKMEIEKPVNQSFTGWTSWYHYYQNISETIILENLHQFSKHQKKIDIFQIDDGYQTAVGDWLSVDQGKFPRGMGIIADEIHKEGCRAGIWLAPFACEKNSKLCREHQDWILKDERGKPVMAGCNWTGFYALDFYHPKVREYLQQVFSVILQEWNYDMVKLDFLYAVCILPRKNKTRGQIMTEAMQFLRDCVGDKWILGCGVPLGPAFGKVDFCRIGCDVSLDWDDKFYMKVLLRERISTKYAIGNAIGRRQLNHRAFLNDPDVFLLRDENIKLTKHQKEMLATVNHIFGSLIFTSDNLKFYQKEQFTQFDHVMQKSNIKVQKVNYEKNGVTEIYYKDGTQDYLLLINLCRTLRVFQDQNHNTEIDLEPFSCKTIVQ